MSFINVNGFGMYAEEYGTGEPVLLLHGSLATGQETFKKQISVLKQHYRCICVDLRGHGQSKWNQYDWNTETLSEDIMELMNVLQIEKAHLIGHSMGGDVAMYCAVNHPDRVKSLVVISSAGMVNDNIISYLEQLHPDRIDKDKFGRILEKMRGLYGGDWEKLLEHTIWNCSTYPCFSEQQLKQIKVPFLLIRGGADVMVLDSEVQILMEHVPYLAYRFVEGGDHFLHGNGETLEAVNEEIVRFLNVEK